MREYGSMYTQNRILWSGESALRDMKSTCITSRVERSAPYFPEINIFRHLLCVFWANIVFIRTRMGKLLISFSNITHGIYAYRCGPEAIDATLYFADEM